MTTGTNIFFSDYFDVSPSLLEEYGAFDISIVSDLPLFIDPFLLFTSNKPEYLALHDSIVLYLEFLKSKASKDLDPGLIKSWYHFKEVKQNWLGFTVLGNGGHALGPKFAASLNSALEDILSNVGNEKESNGTGTHLEKLALIGPGVGRDGVSDFATNLIKHYLLKYTEKFARDHMREDQCREFAVTRAAFNYKTETWETRRYYLPSLRGDFVLLTPIDILTRDDTWISRDDYIRQFTSLGAATEDDELRAKINNYFRKSFYPRQSIKDRNAAIDRITREFPELVDLYIKTREDQGELAQSTSEAKANDTHKVLVDQVKLAIPDLEAKTEFYQKPWTSYEEALDRVQCFKDYVENKDGYKVINRAGSPFAQEPEVQLFFGLIWCKSDFDVNREPNNGRGPVDFKVSFGAGDKSLIEFKLASNKSLKRNLENQVAIYEAANDTRQSVKVILCYTDADQRKVDRILRQLSLHQEESVVVIDARNDNKPSGSKA
ncbi:hypothetical protein ACIO53_29965 [Streptomyces sp. NPDC087305]|uniref:hypothetical protein n=1 Tax=Streptomyces sp. NPDC087305 TaxID=3365781 RepID=UPI00380C40F2